MKNFALIGAAGYIAPRHMKAIRDTNNECVKPPPQNFACERNISTSKQLSSAIKAIEEAVTTRSEKSIRKAMKTWGDLNSNNLDNRH